MGLLDRALFGKGGFEGRVPEIEESLGEPIEEAWNANRLQGAREVGGKLILSRTKLIFYPHRFESEKVVNLIRALSVLSPADGIRLRGEGKAWGAALESIETVATKGRLSPDLVVTDKEGGTQRFNVTGAEAKILPKICEAMDALPGADAG